MVALRQRFGRGEGIPGVVPWYPPLLTPCSCPPRGPIRVSRVYACLRRRVRSVSCDEWTRVLVPAHASRYRRGRVDGEPLTAPGPRGPSSSLFNCRLTRPCTWYTGPSLVSSTNERNLPRPRVIFGTKWKVVVGSRGDHWRELKIR